MEKVDSRVRLVRVFNFSVANAHNYGGDGVLVHNSEAVSLYAFQGNARLARGNSPLIATGHVGLSADAGRIIYGFGPIKPDSLGSLTDDTMLFNQVAAGYFNKGSRELKLYSLEQIVDKTTFTKRLEQIKNRGNGSKYMLPQTNIPFPANTYNCATFWGQTGIILPEKSGILGKYIPAMINQGAKIIK